MSLILEALNRAEQKRQDQAQVPDIHSVHPAAPLSSVPAKSRLWLVASLLLLAVVAGVGVWLLSSRASTAPEPSVAPGDSAPMRVSDASTPVVVVAEAVAVSEQKAIEVERAALSAAADVSSAPAPSLLASTPASAREVDQLYAAKEAEANPVEQLYQAEEPAVASQTIVTPFDAAPPPAAPQLPARYLASIESVPLFDDLAWSQKLTVPTISYSRHDYLPSDISTVVINGEIRSVGNIVSVGQFIVEDILADGVVLRHGALHFKLRALNGWVNM